MNDRQRQREEAEDLAQILTLPKLLARAIFFGALLLLLIWGPWALAPRLLVCVSGGLAYAIIGSATPLRRYM